MTALYNFQPIRDRSTSVNKKPSYVYQKANIRFCHKYRFCLIAHPNDFYTEMGSAKYMVHIIRATIYDVWNDETLPEHKDVLVD